MMASHGKVLILDSDTARASDLCSRLHYLNYEPVIPSADNSSGAFLDEHGIAVVLGDLQRGDGMGRTLDELKARQPSLPCLCLASDDAKSARPEYGINWTLDLPMKRSQLTRLLGRAERYQGSERRHRLTGNSISIRQVRQLIEHVADFNTSVLVTGQSGTGKELVARLCQYGGARSVRRMGKN